MKIPSLAQRPGDTVLLAKAFLSRFAKEMNDMGAGVDVSAAMAGLKRHYATALAAE